MLTRTSTSRTRSKPSLITSVWLRKIAPDQKECQNNRGEILPRGTRAYADMKNDPGFSLPVEAATRKLLAYCRANDWAGYDPYDALNSRLMALPILQSRVPRIVLTQALKRSPVNVRSLLQIPKTQ